MTKSLSDLKPGDQAILCHLLFRRIVTIDRITKTEIIIGSSQFDRKNGHKINRVSYYSKEWLKIATHELIAKVKAEEQIREAKDRVSELLEDLQQLSYDDNIVATLPYLEQALTVLTSDHEVND